MNENNTLKSRREEAEKIVSEINEISLKAEKIHNSIHNVLELSNIERGKIDNNNKVLFDIIKKSTLLIDSYRKERDRIKKVTRQIDQFFQKSFTPLMTKIDDPKSGFKNKIKENDLLFNEIVRIKNNADDQFIRLKKLVDEYKVKIDNLRIIERSIIKIDNEVKQQGSNISKVNEIADNIKSQIILKQKSIIQSEKEVSLLEQQVKQDSSTVNALLENVILYEKEANETLEKIKKIYQIASNTGLGGAFDARKKEYEIEMKKWQNWVGYTTIGIAIFVIAIYVVHLFQYWGKTVEYDADFYIRFLLTSPLVFYLTFSANQHNKAKRNHEKYSLRTTVALSIESHLELLANNPQYSQKENVDKILDFILNTFNNLYKESYTNEKKRFKEKEEKDFLENKFEMTLDLLKELTKIRTGG
ncbi:MAG: hypothetical protein M0P66_09165 [Salinivirgaceae bacterium]|nr:hypothetical protein [Salinivirgaceae bacterium]